MADCSSCSSNETCEKDREKCMVEVNPFSTIKHIIGVMSGKGGVGKSTVAVSLAKQIKNMGYEVGILDADVTGPSVPRLLGIHHERAVSTEEYIMPVVSKDGILSMSLNYLVEDENSPVIWRGPIVSNVVKQFYTDVFWGNIDFLIVDMPPGTSDVALTVMQSIPIDGIVMVTLPQDMVSMIVAKAVQMARTMKVPVLGVIENMSYVTCPGCNEKIHLFGNGNIDQLLFGHQLELLGELPMSQEIAGEDPNLEAHFGDIAKKIIRFSESK